jgi:hypothetical protein
MQLMHVRNSCREGMTHNTDLITVEQQERFWFKELNPPVPNYEAYLLMDDITPIGYGLLKWDGERYWMTAGLVPSTRGTGLSRLIINFISEMGHRDGREVWIDVYDDNLALFGDIRVGYEFINSEVQPNGKLLHIMRHNRDRLLGPREGEWMRLKGHPVKVAPAPVQDIIKEMIEVDACR